MERTGNEKWERGKGRKKVTKRKTREKKEKGKGKRERTGNRSEK